MGSERSRSYSPNRRPVVDGSGRNETWATKYDEAGRDTRNVREEDPALYEEGRTDRREERYVEESSRRADVKGPSTRPRGVDDHEYDTGFRHEGGGSQRNGFSLLIRNLDRNTRPDKIRGAFEQFGEVRDVYLPQDHYTRRPRGFGFVEFLHEEDAINAMAELNDSELDGSRISVLKANEKRKSPDEMRYRDPRRDRDRPRRRERGSDYRHDERDYRDDSYGRGYGGHRDRYEDSRYERGGYGDRGYGGGGDVGGNSRGRPYYRDDGNHRGVGGNSRGGSEYYDRNHYRDRSHSPRRF